MVGEDGKEMVIKHVMVPTQKEIEEMIVERKKQYLLEKFVGSIWETDNIVFIFVIFPNWNLESVDKMRFSGQFSGF